MYFWTVIGLAAIGCLSPLLTLAALWQKKEWRIDRLKEHLRSEGYTRQIFGIMRPLIVVGAIGLSIARFPINGIAIGICGLALLSVLQVVLRKQRLPVWTLKAMAIVGLAFVLSITTALLLPAGVLLLVIPIAQSIPLLVAWTVFLPIDYALKKHIMQKARTVRSEFHNATVIGITGSVGKTTTKELLTHIMSEQNMLCTPAYVNSEMGVAKWLLKELEKRDRSEPITLIIEMGAYKKGEIKRLCDIAQPQIGIITYIGTQHIALFGSQEKLRNAKGELFMSLPKNGHAFVNADNNISLTLLEQIPCPKTTIGTAGHCDLEAHDIEETGKGIRFHVGSTAFSVPLHGTHNVTNVLLAIGIAKHVGIKDSVIQQRLQTFTPPHSTFSVRNTNGVTILDDTHNASPESFRAAIAWAKSQPGKDKILLTPGLIELGTNEDRIHQELGSQASGIFSRVIFTTKHGIDAFAKGYTGTVELYAKNTQSVQTGDLLVCVGRVHDAAINRLLP